MSKQTLDITHWLLTSRAEAYRAISCRLTADAAEPTKSQLEVAA